MKIRKENRKFYFSVEGYTELWYLNWLQQQINESETSKFTVSFDSKREKDPVSRVKSLSITQETTITHVFDFESEEKVHANQFHWTLDRMKESLSLGKQIVYQLGYSNFSFELWMILHKVDCNGPLTHRRQYLVFVNRAFGENFKGLNQFKKENNFARILKKMTLNDVRDAISRSRVIMKQNCINELRFLQHNGYDYCEDNPSLTIWESISSILETCKLSRRI